MMAQRRKITDQHIFANNMATAFSAIKYEMNCISKMSKESRYRLIYISSKSIKTYSRISTA